VEICVLPPRRLNFLIVETLAVATTARNSRRAHIAARVERAILSDYGEVLLSLLPVSLLFASADGSCDFCLSKPSVQKSPRMFRMSHKT